MDVIIIYKGKEWLMCGCLRVFPNKASLPRGFKCG